MNVIINNLNWMGWNVFLAILPIPFCYLTIKYRKNLLGVIFFVLWLIFFPNSIYLVTDIQYLPQQLSKTVVAYDALLIGQYVILVVLGVLTYFFALKPMVKKFKTPKYYIFIFNFLVAFAVALGKIQRTESWDVLTSPVRVINDINKTLASPQLLLFVIIFGVLINFIWFYFSRLL